MEISSGIILHKNENGNIKFFMCTPDGPYFKNKTIWSFPKGHMEMGETPFETALREFHEETSFSLTNKEFKYKYYGLVKQNSHKKVHVFSKPYENEELINCYSNKCVSIIKGVKYVHNEIRDYKWVTLKEYIKKGVRPYIPILKEIINDYYNQKC